VEINGAVRVMALGMQYMYWWRIVVTARV